MGAVGVGEIELESVLGVVSGLLGVCVSLVVSRLALLLSHVGDFLSDLGRGDLIWGARSALWRVVTTFDAASWEALLHDSTSPRPRAIELRDHLLDVGLGKVGSASIPPHIWLEEVPPSFLGDSAIDFPGVRPLGPKAVRMVEAIRRENASLFRELGQVGVGEEGREGPRPNSYAFVIPKNARKCSLIMPLVSLNKATARKPRSFTLPTMEDMAILVTEFCGEGGGGSQGRIRLPPGCGQRLLVLTPTPILPRLFPLPIGVLCAEPGEPAIRVEVLPCDLPKVPGVFPVGVGAGPSHTATLPRRPPVFRAGWSGGGQGGEASALVVGGGRLHY